MEEVAGRYVLLDRIGTGGSAEVWRAFDAKARRYCAAKVIRGPEAATLVRAVYEQAVRLDHPHVATPYAWAADDERVLLAMDLVAGGSLAMLVRDHGVLPPRYAAEILRQLLDALAHVHGAGLVHRDVKPANLLLEPTGTGAPRVRLADFGLVLTPGRPRVTGDFAISGTPGYLAPESLVTGEQGVSQDLYAAGMVGVEMLTGVALLEGRDAPDQVPEALWRLISALGAADPAARPESAAEAVAALAEVLDGWPLAIPATVPGSDEPVEVYDHVGPLPAGWGPDGPVAAARIADPAGEPGHPAPTALVETAALAETAEITVALEIPEPRKVRPARGRQWWAAAAVGGVVTIGCAVGAIAVASHGGSGDPAAPAPTKTSQPGRAPEPGVQAGGSCSWNQAGDSETAADGRRVSCAQDSKGAYSWTVVG